ncbi:hypothetical protein [Desulfarculus baarsii]
MLALAGGCATKPPADDAWLAERRAVPAATAKQRLSRYPGVKAVEGDRVIFADGSSMPFDDGRPKTFGQALEDADIHDHFARAYPAFTNITPPAVNDDPGRLCCDAFLKKLYGHSRQDIEANLVEVTWPPNHGGKSCSSTKSKTPPPSCKKPPRPRKTRRASISNTWSTSTAPINTGPSRARPA